MLFIKRYFGRFIRFFTYCFAFFYQYNENVKYDDKLVLVFREDNLGDYLISRKIISEHPIFMKAKIKWVVNEVTYEVFIRDQENLIINNSFSVFSPNRISNPIKKYYQLRKLLKAIRSSHYIIILKAGLISHILILFFKNKIIAYRKINHRNNVGGEYTIVSKILNNV